MSAHNRFALAIATLLLLSVYVLPIWRITLTAPQYPEGLGLLIRVNTITGQGPHDLANINGLNHYIGMKEIHPDDIRELKVMPYLFGFLIALGLAGAATGKRWILAIWVALFCLTALVGLIDFYLWEYDYGHNLSADAAIKIPGMTYQPPLLGSKKLLNIIATSWPASGGLLAVVSLLTGATLLFKPSLFEPKKPRHPSQ